MAAPQDGAESLCGVGARLRRARERAGLSPIEAAERLHVDPSVLQALEAEQFERLGAPVYVRGYIRHFADLVREPPGELEALYGSSVHASRTPDLTHIPRAESERLPSMLIAPGIVVVVAVGLIGVGWWIAGALSRSARMRRITVPAVSAAHAGVAVAAKGASAASVGPSASVAPVSTNEPVAATDVLKMHFSANSWVEVYGAHGKRLFYDVGHAGSTRTVRGVPPLRLVLGDAPAVSLEVDGKPVHTPSAAPDAVVHLRIGRSGRVSRVKPAPSEASRDVAVGPSSGGSSPGAETVAGSDAKTDVGKP